MGKSLTISFAFIHAQKMILLSLSTLEREKIIMSNEELELLSDSKYRQFISAVEKALKSFEYSSEWADLISALGKLSKVGL